MTRCDSRTITPIFHQNARPQATFPHISQEDRIRDSLWNRVGDRRDSFSQACAESAKQQNFPRPLRQPSTKHRQSRCFLCKSDSAQTFPTNETEDKNRCSTT